MIHYWGRQAGKGTVSAGYCTVYSLKVGTETMGIKSGQNVLWGPTLSPCTTLNREIMKKSWLRCSTLRESVRWEPSVQYEIMRIAPLYCIQCCCAIARAANGTKVEHQPCCSLISMHISPMSWLLSCLHAKRLTNNEKTNQSRRVVSFTCKI